MTRPFLFGGSASGQSQNKYLVEFKAGKMTMKDRIVSADKRKGLVYVNQTDDSLMHFCWKDRTTGVVEDDLIIFPDDVVFKRVEQCKTGRVFVLKFKSSSRKCFYWLQEPKTDRDNEFWYKVNQYLNNPPTSTSRAGGSGSSSSQGLGSLQAELANLGDGELQNVLSNMSQQQLIQLLSGVGGMSGVASLSNLLSSGHLSGRHSASSESSQQSIAETLSAAVTVSQPTSTQPASATSSASSRTSSSSIQLSDLQNILSGLNVPPPAASAQPSSTSSSALTAETLQPLFDNKDLMDRLRNLLPPSFDAGSLPSGEQLRSTVQSPQFQQALSIFSAALQSGQLGPLMQQFGMSEEVVNAANSGDMEAFVRALQTSKQGEGSTPSTGASSKEKDKDDDKDEDMSLD